MINVTKQNSRLLMCSKVVLISFDILINALCDYARKDIHVLLFIFIMQDLGIIISITLIIFSFLSAFVYQGDFASSLYKQFRVPIFVNVLYLVVTIVVHALVLMIRWETPLKFLWPNSLFLVYIFHKLLAVIHYYFYKRIGLVFCDPTWNSESKDKTDEL